MLQTRACLLCFTSHKTPTVPTAYSHNTSPLFNNHHHSSLLNNVTMQPTADIPVPCSGFSPLVPHHNAVCRHYTSHAFGTFYKLSLTMAIHSITISKMVGKFDSSIN